ncbi:MAG TPA: serine/threonine-protein kinase [Gemmatimonadales bacterium]|jgi:serine/threonine-protein kinase
MTAPEDTGTIERLRALLEGRYTVERQVGQGGMATVFLAIDLRHDRRVAIKVLHPDLAASVGAERFEREIRVAAKLQHPHILTLYDSGGSGGLLYYVMPFVEGESLRDKLNREKMLSVDEAIGLVIEIAEALGYAHSMGIVHRDIKPENVLLSGGHALVADFGIARAVSAGEHNKLTQTGTAVGTPVYMSPEQAMGDEVGPSADLYSLACVAFELLTGEPPFTGANARAIMARHTVEAPPGIRTVRDTVPEEVEEAILWTLNKVPADRPKTAAQLIEALAMPMTATATRRSAFRSRVTVTPRRLTAAHLAHRPIWKRPGFIAAAVLVLALGGAMAWKLGSRHRAPPNATGADPSNIAVLYFDDLSTGHSLGYLADGLTEGLIGQLREVNGLHVVSRGGSAQYRGSSLPLDSIAHALGAGTLVRGSVEPEGSGDVRVIVRVLDGAIELYRASFRKSAGNPLAIRDSLSAEVAEMVRKRVGETVRLQSKREGTSRPEAWVLFQRGEGSLRQLDSLGPAGDTMAIARAWAQGDSLLTAAEALDPHWADPIVLRAQLAYRRSRFAGDLTVVGQWIATGLGHADRALALDDHDPDALETRGTLRYWKWLNQLERDPQRAAKLLLDAKADLDLATTVNPSQAGAWATLSHLYYQLPTSTGLDVNTAARRAMEADAFLGNADVILDRLFLSSYDLEQFPDAQHWCDEGLRRFPANFRFTECRLMMLTTRAQQPDVRMAWRLADSVARMESGADSVFGRLSANVYVAAVLARANLRDSSRHVVGRSLGNASVDPSRDLTYRAAFVYGLLSDTAAAVTQLATYISANPPKARTFASDPGWWLRPIENAAAFRQLVGASSH